MQALSGNLRPDLPTSLMNMSLLLCLPRDMHLCRSSSNVPHLPALLKLLQNLTYILFVRYRNPCACHAKKKHILFFKNCTRPSVFKTFDFEMCFAPQLRALFGQSQLPKCSEPDVLCAFWLGNVLCAATPCIFSTAQLPKAVRQGGAFFHFDFQMCCAPQRHALFQDSTSKSAPKLSFFFTFWLQNVLCTTAACNCSSLISPDGSAPASLVSLKTLESTRCFALFYLSTPIDLPSSSFLFSDRLWSSLFFLSLLWLFPPLLFHLPILSGVWLPNFLWLKQAYIKP